MVSAAADIFAISSLKEIIKNYLKSNIFLFTKCGRLDFLHSLSGWSAGYFDIEKTLGFHSEISGFDYRIMFNYAHFKYAVDVTTPLGSQHYVADSINIYTLGIEKSWGQLTLTSEVLIDKMHFNWYSSIGYNIDKFTPYVTYAESHHAQKNNSLLLGLRYELTTTVSLNAEWKYTDANDGSNGELITVPTDGDTDAQLYTLMLNFIF